MLAFTEGINVNLMVGFPSSSPEAFVLQAKFVFYKRTWNMESWEPVHRLMSFCTAPCGSVSVPDRTSNCASWCSMEEFHSLTTEEDSPPEVSHNQPCTLSLTLWISWAVPLRLCLADEYTGHSESKTEQKRKTGFSWLETPARALHQCHRYQAALSSKAKVCSSTGILQTFLICIFDGKKCQIEVNLLWSLWD